MAFPSVVKNYEYNTCITSSPVKTEHMTLLSKKLPLQYGVNFMQRWRAIFKILYGYAAGI